MILSTLISNELAPAGRRLSASAPSQRASAGTPKPDHASCRLQIEHLIREIETPEVREVVDLVFSDLLRLLECLSLTESHLRQVELAEETFAVFQLIHDEALLLVEFIRDEGLNCTALSEEVLETLDGISFAITHDLQRVFEPGPRAGSEKPPHVMADKAYRAHDLLTNCLQQSTVTLASIFDSELVASRLFNTSDLRYRQSLQLCKDLTALMQLVGTSEKNINISAIRSLSAGLDTFRSESMEFLMYSDWPQFESFCERINVAETPPRELEPVLHQFGCYLETLLSQVRMRAVLANVGPVGFGVDETVTSLLESDQQLTPFSSSHTSVNRDHAWNLLGAVA